MSNNRYTTTAAFAELIMIRGIHNDLGVSGGTARGWRSAVKKNPDCPEKWGISIELMERMLTRCGLVVVQEKIWATTSGSVL